MEKSDTFEFADDQDETLAHKTDACWTVQSVVAASNSINSKQNLSCFASSVLSEVGKLIDTLDAGIICSLPPHAEPPLQVIATSGDFEYLPDHAPLAVTHLEGPTAAIEQAILHREHQWQDEYSICYFNTQETGAHAYLMLLKHPTPLSVASRSLLNMFCESITNGFQNIALLSRLSDLAYRDPVLGIHNRNWLVRELELMTPRELDQTLLLKVEIEQFDERMLTFGEPFCNRLLQQVYQALSSQLPEAIAIAKTWDNTFVLLLPRRPDFSHHTFKQRLIMVGDFSRQLFLTASLLELHHFSHRQPETILVLARAACTAARKAGKQFIHVDQQFSDRTSAGYNLLQDLRQAINDQQLSIVLQPKVRLVDEAVVGLEALVRWQHPDGHFVPPSDFIPIAEASGEIGLIDRLVFKQVVTALQALNTAGYALPIAFNLSSSDLLDGALMAELIDFARSDQPGARLLQVEITETLVMRDYAQFRQVLDRLIDAGIQISIDDFGTGYSSLSQITNLRAHCLKIDKSFVDDVTTDINARHITEMILRLGQRFGFSIIAEGIEHPEQKAYLLQQGCEMGQGYLFARPMPLDNLLEWLCEQIIVNDKL
ncbi:EAL domain-containing protein [Oceanisphaera sp.]|uniref:bifunctional diguanylate cyclase/phosphodiesterase n=1 Tax=Oceanisphaera sp. TaxID=1929979 RepID=UPI003A90F98B